jgi:hypothetical protein
MADSEAQLPEFEISPEEPPSVAANKKLREKDPATKIRVLPSSAERQKANPDRVKTYPRRSKGNS